MFYLSVDLSIDFIYTYSKLLLIDNLNNKQM